MGPARSRWPQLLDLLGFGLAVMLFCALAWWRLDLPGLYQDEALDAVPALSFLQGHGGGPYALLLGRLSLPLMVSDHVGPTSTYLLLPFLSLRLPSLLALRWYEFGCGFAALALSFLWLRRAAAPGFAGLGALLLTAMPSFWLGARNGVHVSFVMLPIGVGALLSLDRWRRTSRPAWLYLGAFLLGAGLSTKILFLWFLLALAVGATLVDPRALRTLRGRRAACAAWFALGAGPLLLFNLLSRGLTLRVLLASLRETPNGVHNAAFLANLRTQLGSIGSLLDGSWLTWAGAAPHNPFSIWCFAAAATYLALSWRAREWRRLRFALMAVGVMLVASCFTLTNLGPKHLVLLLPFVPAVTMGALALAWERRAHPPSLAVFLALSALAAAQFVGDLRSDLEYRRALAETRGVGLFSKAHDEAAAWLAAHGVTRPAAADWGFASNLEVLSRGEIQVQQIFSAPPAPYRAEVSRARERLAAGDRVFLFHDASCAVVPASHAAVAEAARGLGLDLTSIVTFGDGAGRPVIWVAEAVPRGER